MEISLFHKKLTGLLFGLLILLTACGSEQTNHRQFTLQSVEGPVSLTQFEDKLVLLFFGYTHCPDICPATMNNVASALKKLNAADQDRVRVLFVTVDPARDSAEHLAKYVAFFHSNIIGLTGTPEAIKQTAGAYDAEFFKQPKKDDPDYEMIHTSMLFLIDSSGKMLDIMSHHTSAADIAIALRKWLNTTSAQ